MYCNGEIWWEIGDSRVRNLVELSNFGPHCKLRLVSIVHCFFHWTKMFSNLYPMKQQPVVNSAVHTQTLDLSRSLFLWLLLLPPLKPIREPFREVLCSFPDLMTECILEKVGIF